MMDTCEDLKARAQQIFAVCDKEQKGYVTRRDIQVNKMFRVFEWYFKGIYVLHSADEKWTTSRFLSVGSGF